MGTFQDTFANADYISSFVSGQVSGGYLIGNGDGSNTVPRWSASSTNLASNFTASSITGMAYTQEKSADSIGRLQFSSDGSNIKGPDNSDLAIGSYEFDGINDEIEVPGNTSIDDLPQGVLGFTCSVWVNPGSITNKGTIFSKGPSENWVFHIDGTSFDKAKLRWYHGAGSVSYEVQSDEGELELNKWSHVCFKWDGDAATALTCFVNGREVAVTRNSGAGSLDNSTESLVIGIDPAIGNWDGLISDMIWWASELTDAQMKNIFLQGKIPTGPAARWKLDGNANDSSANTNNGTVNGAVSSTNIPDVGYLLDGGKIQSFDGVDDYVEIPDTSALAGTGPFSVSVWVMPTVAGGGTDLRPGIWGHYVHSTVEGGEQSFAGSAIWCTSSRIGFGGRNGAGNYFGYFTTAAVLVTNKWLHIVCTYEAVDPAPPLIYIDGTSRALSTWILLGPFGPLKNPVAPGTIGEATSFTDTLMPQQFAGYISNFAYYNKALSAAEVRAEYERGCPDVTDTDLYGYFPLEGDFNDHSDTSQLTNATNYGSTEIAFDQYRPVSGVAQKTIDVTDLSLTTSFYYNHVSTNQGLFGARLDEISLFYVAGGGGGGGGGARNLITAPDTLASNFAFSTVSGNAVIIDSRDKFDVKILAMNTAYDCTLRKDTSGGDVIFHLPAGNTRVRGSIRVADGTDVYLDGDSNTTLTYTWSHSPIV